MSGLALDASLVARITAHARRVWPEECCGVLLGRGRRVREIVEADNVAPDERRRRYVIAPETLLAVHKEARRTGRDVVGYYHSHPDGEACPSGFDLEHAWPEVSYLIVALDDAGNAEMRSWRLAGDRFEEEAWSVP